MTKTQRDHTETQKRPHTKAPASSAAIKVYQGVKRPNKGVKRPNKGVKRPTKGVKSPNKETYSSCKET